MNLSDLIIKAQEVKRMSYEDKSMPLPSKIPLKMYGKDCEINLELKGEGEDCWVEVRHSTEQDEKITIIMQMFEEGSNDSIAMTVANKIKQEAVDKVCDILNHYCNRTGVHPSRRADIINHIRKEMEVQS